MSAEPITGDDMRQLIRLIGAQSTEMGIRNYILSQATGTPVASGAF